MNRKSSLMAWGLITVFLSAVVLFNSAGTSLAQNDLCSGYARQYADRYANSGGNAPNALAGGESPSSSYWSLLYDHAYDSCGQEGVVH